MNMKVENSKVLAFLEVGGDVFLYQAPATSKTVVPAKVDRLAENQLAVSVQEETAQSEIHSFLQQEITMRWKTTGSWHECPVLVEKIESNTLVLIPRLKEQREFLRVRIDLPIAHEIILEADFQKTKEEILNQAATPEDLESETGHFWHAEDLGEKMDERFSQMNRLYKQIDAKLDYLISLAEGGERKKAATHSVSLLDISGAGLAFFNAEEIPVGAYVKASIQLSRFPLTEVAVLCQTVRCLPQPEPAGQNLFEIGLQFLTIHRNGREQLFRFISRIERKMLRERKEAMNP